MAVRYLPSGDTALTVEFGDGIDRDLSRQVLQWRAIVDDAALPGVVETVPTYRSLMIHYDPLATSQADVIEAVTPLLNGARDKAMEPSAHWRFPFCCDGEDFAPDLNGVAEASRMSAEEIAEVMTTTAFYVYMLGFAPGQPYMGDLPERLAIPRRKNPITGVPAGSVVTATGLAIIYPVPNPTGWHVIGRTPVRLFDPHGARPALLSAGDRVSFHRVTREEYAELAARIDAGDYAPEIASPS